MTEEQKVISSQDAMKLAIDSYKQGAINAIDIAAEVLLSDEGRNITKRNDFLGLLSAVKMDMLKAVNNA